MSVSGVGSSAGSNPFSLSSSAATNPYAAIVQQQQADVTSLFGSADSQLSALTPTAAAYSLYENPALLLGLTKWDGSQTPGSQRAADPSAVQGNTDGVQADYSFNPFDQSSWDSQYPPGSFVDTLA